MSKKSSRSGRRRAYLGDRHEKPVDSVNKSLNDIGLSVFRSLGDRSLDECCDVFKDSTRTATTQSRGETNQYGMALSLVSLIEVRARNFDGSISTQEVIDELYDSIPSLRKPMTIGVGRVGMFGGRNSLLRSFGVAIHDDERHRITDQRDAIIEVLNEYSDPPLTRENWSLNDVPHISIGRVSMSSISEFQRRAIIGSMNEALPLAIHLDRATLHNPAK